MDTTHSKKTIESLLKEDGYIVYTIKGVSMNPMLVQNRDLVTIRARKPGERFRENDVVLYKRKPDRALTLHRIVEVKEDGYVILGDNCMRREYGIRDEDILGVLTQFTQKGKTRTVEDPDYLEYVRRLRKTEEGRIHRKQLRAKLSSLKKRASKILAKEK